MGGDPAVSICELHRHTGAHRIEELGAAHHARNRLGVDGVERKKQRWRRVREAGGRREGVGGGRAETWHGAEA